MDECNNAAQYPDMKVATLEKHLDVCKEYNLNPVIEIKENADPETMPELAALLLSRMNIHGFSEKGFVKQVQKAGLSALLSAYSRAVVNWRFRADAIKRNQNFRRRDVHPCKRQSHNPAEFAECIRSG